jgi:hypothetical protein
MPLFSFNIDSFQITDTRSVHTDPDYGVLTVKVGNSNPDPPTLSTVFSPAYGNLNNGKFNGNMSIQGVNILPDSPVTFNYMILNAGSTTLSAVDTVLKNVSQALTNATDPTMNYRSVLIPVAAEYAAQFNTVLKPTSCDGLVAAEQDTFTYEQLASFTAGSPSSYTQSTAHTGPKLSGCNSSKSGYTVYWSMQEVVEVPSLINEPIATAKSQLEALGFTVGVGTEKGSLVGGQDHVGLTPARTKINLTPSQTRK